MASKKKRTDHPSPQIILLALLLVSAILIFHSPVSAPSAAPPSSPAVPSSLLSSPSSPDAPIFTNPNQKLARLSDENFSRQLFFEAVAYEPLLNASGTQAHMGFWSGANNHGNLVRLLDDINNFKSGPDGSAQRAIWDEGAQSSLQYSDYVEMNAREHWYERASPRNGSVLIYGHAYVDPYPVSFSQADAIWGAYSQRYTDMARYLKNATSKKVQVWCYVQGAKANRVFYTYEYPELVTLESEGVVEVHFAKKADANWKNPDDWIAGMAHAPMPAN